MLKDKARGLPERAPDLAPMKEGPRLKWEMMWAQGAQEPK